MMKVTIVYVKINPNIHCAERKKNDEVISYNPEINKLSLDIKKLGDEPQEKKLIL